MSSTLHPPPALPRLPAVVQPLIQPARLSVQGRACASCALSALGLLSPMLVAVATAFGSVSVANALLLRHCKGSASC